MSEIRILCEGFHDRAFWAGWLKHLGCSDDGFKPGTAGYPRRDPFGDFVRGEGQKAYHSPSGQFLRVMPCHGKAKILRAAETRLVQRISKSLVRLIIAVDPDTLAGGPTVPTGLRTQDVLNFLQQQVDSSAALNASKEIEIDGGATRISLIRWEVNDPPTAGVPNQQTLERLVCSALNAAYPARAQAVHNWLNARPVPPPSDPKEHAWSYMAGWYAEAGCEFFYENLWNDANIVAELQSR